MKGKNYWKRQFEIIMNTNGAFANRCALLEKKVAEQENLLYKKVTELIDALDKIVELEEKIERLESQFE